MRSNATVSSKAIVDAFKGTDLTLRTAKDEHIEKVMRLVDGNISAAAALLGINRRSLQRRACRARRGGRGRGRGRGR